MPRFHRPAPRADGYKSSLEARVAKQIQEKLGLPHLTDVPYETLTVPWVMPVKSHRYKPDFPLGVYGLPIIETKGIFDAPDREKHVLVKEQHPELDIRFVFTRSNAPIYPGAKKTMAEWCEEHGFEYADKIIPAAWFLRN